MNYKNLKSFALSKSKHELTCGRQGNARVMIATWRLALASLAFIIPVAAATSPRFHCSSFVTPFLQNGASTPSAPLTQSQLNRADMTGTSELHSDVGHALPLRERVAGAWRPPPTEQPLSWSDLYSRAEAMAECHVHWRQYGFSTAN